MLRSRKSSGSPNPGFPCNRRGLFTLLTELTPGFLRRLYRVGTCASTHDRYFDRPAALCQALFATFADMQKHPEKVCGLLAPFF
jgi:hypothetical protein